MKLHSIAFVLVAACGGGSKPAPKTPDTTAPATSASGSMLTLAELKFYDKQGMRMQIHADGKIEMEAKQEGQPAAWTQVGTIGTDGSVTSKDGKAGQLQADGTFKTAEGQDAGFKLDGDTLEMGGKKVTLDAKGDLLVDGAPLPDKDLRIEGATDEKSRRTALLVVGLLMGSPGGESSPPPTAAPAPKK
jgi:hypothetical protein